MARQAVATEPSVEVLAARVAELTEKRTATALEVAQAQRHLDSTAALLRRTIATGTPSDENYAALEEAERVHRGAERRDRATEGAVRDVEAQLGALKAKDETAALLVSRDQTVSRHAKAEAALRAAIVDVILAAGEVEASHLKRKQTEAELVDAGAEVERGGTRSPLESHWVGDAIREAWEPARQRLGGGEVRLLGNLHLYLPLLAK